MDRRSSFARTYRDVHGEFPDVEVEVLLSAAAQRDQEPEETGGEDPVVVAMNVLIALVVIAALIGFLAVVGVLGSAVVASQLG